MTKKRAVIFEDEDYAFDFFRIYLEGIGFEVVRVTNAKDGEESFHQDELERADVYLCDYEDATRDSFMRLVELCRAVNKNALYIATSKNLNDRYIDSGLCTEKIEGKRVSDLKTILAKHFDEKEEKRRELVRNR